MRRRELLAGMGTLAAGAALGAFGAPALAERSAPSATSLGPGDFPRKGDFAIPEGITFINSAYTHPLPVASAQAMRGYLGVRTSPGAEMPDSGELSLAVRSGFAAMINAKPSEISFIPNTCTGENLVVNALGIPAEAGSGINVVTDALHFDGALVHLQALQRDRGLDLRVVMPKEWRIERADLERVVDGKTRLIEISLVAMYNGFEHDLKAVCDLAHAHGAYVYADIIQAAGAAPIDVRASGVDFCACAGFKWLMSDFGLGFLYAREELLESVVRRSQWGYHSVSALDTHFLLYDPPGPSFLTWTAGTSAASHFEVGSNALGALAALGVSVPYLRSLGVERIQAHRQPLLKRLREEMPRLGFVPVTPPDTTSPLITFATRDGRRAAERLKRAKVNVRVAENYVRFSPSVFNDLGDIDRALEALS
jgi:selenocysteine lyase/cysteine desulfurase